jgi:hypothetical protein
MACVYIDFERNLNDIIEIGAILVKENKVLNEFHRFVFYLLNDYHHYYRSAENSHCIGAHVLKYHGTPLETVKMQFHSFLDEIKEPFIIKGYGDDVNQEALQHLFPFLKNMLHVSYDQVHLQPLEERQLNYNHIAVMKMKTSTNLVQCHQGFHRVEYNPSWKRANKTPNHTQIAKMMYGYHCALFDCYELAFCDETLKAYCCDIHFKDLLAWESDKFNNSSLEFIDC